MTSVSHGVLALLLTMPLSAAAGSAGGAGRQATSQTAPADVAQFIGDWTLALQGPDGPGTFALAVKVDKEKERVVGQISVETQPTHEITDIALIKDSLVLSYWFDYEGSPVDATVSLTPDKEGKVAARIDFAGGAYTMSGTATKKER